MECLAFKVRIGIISPLNPSVTTELNFSKMSPLHLTAPERVVGHREAVDRVVHTWLPGHTVSKPVQSLVILSPSSLTSLTSSLTSPDVPNSLAASKALTRPLPLVAPSNISV